MESRILPVAEWSRLAGTELANHWRFMDPDAVQIIVVEDEAGAIVGTWALMPFIHAEGFWIAPDHRGKSSVLRRLWAELVKTAKARGLQSVVTSSISDDVTRILESRNAMPMPASYVLPMDPRPNAKDRALGEQFHEQLLMCAPNTPHHVDDAAHDAAVGRAIRIGVLEHDPRRAERQYNAWACTHGYVPVRFLEQRTDGSVVVDIVDAVVAVAPDCTITLVTPEELAVCQQ